MSVENIKETIEKIREKKDIIARERDAIRTLYGEISDLIEGLDSADYELELACDDLDRAIDTLSERL